MALLEVQHLSKSYGGISALEDVSFSVSEGSIHALCGENGAGKSTLIKMLSGAVTPSSGHFVLDGTRFSELTPREAMSRGIRAIYQEFTLIPELSVGENIFYGHEPTSAGFCNFAKMNADTLALCEQMGVEINPEARVATLGVAQQQVVEILKAVSEKARLLIMDEPTAPLTVRETEVFFGIVQRLRQAGTTILFISHRLEEVFELCDEITVLCDGRLTATRPVNELSRRELISLMVGRELVEDYPPPAQPPGEVILGVEGLSNSHLHDVSFSLRRGEILGFGGLVGAGRTELARAVIGADRVQRGSMTLRGARYEPKSARHSLRRGVGLIPEDRKREGLVMSLGVKQNISLAILDKIPALRFFIDRAEERRYYEKYAADLEIRTASPDQLVGTLSGGNQQKVVLAKILSRDCDVIIFDEPTRGIDVGVKHEIYKLMRLLADQGKAIIMISSDMPELIGMSDRIAVMSVGHLVADLPKSAISQETILELASSMLSKKVSGE
jgi:ribose transport system ATP-binding protein